jgi:hypothetical protein
MASPRPLIGPGARVAVRSLMTGSTLSTINSAFRDEGFVPQPGAPQDSSARRTLTQEFLDGIDWTDQIEVSRAIQVFERLLVGLRPGDPYGKGQGWDEFVRAMEHDGYQITDAGHINSTGALPWLPPEALASLRDPNAIAEQLSRIRTGLDGDPPLAIGSAKELIESTAKMVLAELGLTWDERKDDLPALVRKAQRALKLDPRSASAGPDGSDAVKRNLGASMTIASGVGELRNRYGTGHGRHGKSGLRPRHGRLAVHAAMTWCLLMIDTLQDPEATWRSADDTDTVT